MEPLNESNGYSSSNAYRGKLVFGLYGKACPKVWMPIKDVLEIGRRMGWRDL